MLLHCLLFMVSVSISIGSEYAALVESLPDSSFSASTHFSDCLPYEAKESKDAWCPTTNGNDDDYLQIDLQHKYVIHSISTWGRNEKTSSENQYVKKYRLSLSNSSNDNSFINYNEGIQFNANNDTKTEVNHILNAHMLARYVRFIPIATQYNNWKSLRVEIYGRPPALIEELANSAFTASSSYPGNNCKPYQSKQSENAWCPANYNNPTDYLQIRFDDEIVEMTSITTFGRKNGDDQRVTSYYLKYSNDCNTFNYYKANGNDPVILIGNTNNIDPVNHKLIPSLNNIKCMRIIPILFNMWKSMRIEAYGFKNNMQETHNPTTVTPTTANPTVGPTVNPTVNHGNGGINGINGINGNIDIEISSNYFLYIICILFILLIVNIICICMYIYKKPKKYEYNKVSIQSETDLEL